MKVGSASDVQKRVKELQTGHPSQLKIHGRWQHLNAYAVEEEAQRLLSPFKTEGEWFDVRVADAAKVIELAIQNIDNKPWVRVPAPPSAAIRLENIASPATRWLWDNAPTFSAALKELGGRPPWGGLAKALAGMGIYGKDGSPISGVQLRQAWYLVRRALEAQGPAEGITFGHAPNVQIRKHHSVVK